MTTALTSSVVELDSIGTDVAFLKRMIAKFEKGAITDADREAMRRRERKHQHRLEKLENLVVAHAGEPWAEAHVSAIASEDF